MFCPAFACLSVCLSVRLLATSPKTTDRSFMKILLRDVNMDKEKINFKVHLDLDLDP